MSLIGLCSCLVDAATHESRRFDVVLGKVQTRLGRVRVQLHRFFKLGLRPPRERCRAKDAHRIGLLSVSAAHPAVIIAAIGMKFERPLIVRNRLVPLLHGVVGPREKVQRLRVRGIAPDALRQLHDCLVDSSRADQLRVRVSGIQRSRQRKKQ